MSQIVITKAKMKGLCPFKNNQYFLMHSAQFKTESIYKCPPLDLIPCNSSFISTIKSCPIDKHVTYHAHKDIIVKVINDLAGLKGSLYTYYCKIQGYLMKHDWQF